jgi:hypothetical protein
VLPRCRQQGGALVTALLVAAWCALVLVGFVWSAHFVWQAWGMIREIAGDLPHRFRRGLVVGVLGMGVACLVFLSLGAGLGYLAWGYR